MTQVRGSRVHPWRAKDGRQIHPFVWGVPVVALTATLLYQSLGSPEIAHAQSVGVFEPDADGDGLADLLETFYKMAPNAIDTDADGYSDTEEFARNSNPKEPNFLPPGPPMNLGVGAHLLGDHLHFVVALYSRDGIQPDDSFTMSLLLNGKFVTIPSEILSKTASYEEFSTHEPGEYLAVLDWPIDARMVHKAGSVAVLATLARNGDFVAADAVNLQAYSGVISQQLTVSRSSQTTIATTGPSVVNLPLNGQGIPDTWVTGSICNQGLSPVGQSGPVVTMEVDSADCEDGWDGYCSPAACAATVGSTIDTIDPGVLIGG